MGKKIKSKIEKLERIPDDRRYYDESDFVKEVIEKINMIIDYLNTQPQAQLEEYEKRIRIKGEIRGLNELAIKKLKEVGSAKLVKDTPEEKKTLVQLRRVFDKKRVKEWDRIAMETYKQATQSTPEQKEEWEKKWEEFFLYVTNNKNWVDGRPEWKGNVYITLYNAMKDFIKQLLSEREVFTKDELFMLKLATNDIHNKGNGAYDEIGEKIERMLSKLNK